MNFRVYINNKSNIFNFFDAAKEFAKLAGVWYYITTDDGVVWTMDDDIFETIN